MKQSEMSKWLKGITIIAMIWGITLVIYLIPTRIHLYFQELGRAEALLIPSLVFFWVSAIPCFLSLFRFWNICTQIGRNNSFCSENAHALKLISYYMLFDCILYIVGTMLVTLMGLLTPSILLIIFLILCLGFALAILSAALSHLVRNASDLKDENDLTI